MEKEKERLKWGSLALGVAVAYGAYLATLLLAAYLTVSGGVEEAQMGRAAWLCALLAAFAGGLTASQRKRNRILPMLAVAGLWAAVMLTGLLATGGIELTDASKLLAACALGGALTLGVTRDGKGKRGKRHKTHRSRRVT